MHRPVPFLLIALLGAWPCTALPQADSSAATAVVQGPPLPGGSGTGFGAEQASWASGGDDPLAVRHAAFDTSAIERLRAVPEYDYDRQVQVAPLFMDRILEQVGRMLRKLFGSKAGELIFSNLHWAILIVALVILLFFLRKRLFQGIFVPEAGKARHVREVEEDITRTDLDGLLHKAEKRGDWRSALRYHYLKVLRKLVDEGRIDWQPKSTDSDYLRQLKDPTLRTLFSELSFVFKWAWYGDAPVDEARYRRLAAGFTAFHSSGDRKP